MDWKRSSVLVLSLILAGQAIAQPADQLPPIARPPPPGFGPPPEPDLPPTERFRRPPPEGLQPLPPGPSSRELQQHDAQERSRWRAAIEDEFRQVWGQYGCFPHPQRHGEWFYEFADRQQAMTPDQQRLLYDLTMERVAAYEAPVSPSERAAQNTRRFLDGLVGRLSRPSAPDYFCR